LLRVELIQKRQNRLAPNSANDRILQEGCVCVDIVWNVHKLAARAKEFSG
jgi:hypothetical protein